MVLVVVRHAESVENADKYNGFYQDQRPYDGRAAHMISRHVVGLTPRGFRQSLWLGKALADIAGNSGRVQVFTSTYRRSIDTAAAAFPAWENRVERTPLLDEQHYGDATYMTKAELFATYPDGADTRRNAKHQWVPPGGGESLADGVFRRAGEFTALAREAVADGQTVIAITHHTTILALRALLENRPLTDVVDEARQVKTPNAGIYRYEPTDGWLVRTHAAAPPPDL
ncbi:histidine phosphatase family protein [Actinacidiphila glaucinigra]|uniref:histidine phosphatase family protein n=1 Tax=Actinacidiphila glaucinigra TaxID=235986 RepID=UPI0035DF268C